MLRLFRVISARRCTVRTNFAPFVDEHFALREVAVAAGDEEAKLHWKLVLNSAYGRFALDGDKLFLWRVVPNDKPVTLAMIADGWEVGQQGPEVTMWRKPVDELDKAQAIMNVATGASITSAARAKLLHGIARADRPIYCDTDSIVCRSLDVPDTEGIGSWAREASADEAAIAGKKMYALFGDMEPATRRQTAVYAGLVGRRRIDLAGVPDEYRTLVERQTKFGDAGCVKMASKGVRLTAPELRRVAAGETVQWQAEAPTFNCAGGFTYLRRDVRMTT